MSDGDTVLVYCDYLGYLVEVEMNQPIYNLHRFLSEEGVTCNLRTAISGPAHLVTDTYVISHSDMKNTFVLKPLTGRTLRIQKPKSILNLLKG